MSSVVCRQIAHFRRCQLLGKGTHGTVWRIENTLACPLVAKCVGPTYPEAEAEALAKLSRKGIPCLYEVLRADDGKARCS